MKPVASPSDVLPAVQDTAYEIRAYRLPAKIFHWLTAILVVFMVTSGVIAKQLGDGSVADMLFSLHKLTGALTLLTVLIRLAYRVLCTMPDSKLQPHRRPVLHWVLYAVIVFVPLLGWAGDSGRAKFSRAIRCRPFCLKARATTSFCCSGMPISLSCCWRSSRCTLAWRSRTT